MIGKDKINSLESDLKKLIDCKALEVFDKGAYLYIPFMMNDAVECYYRFDDIKVHGKWDNKSKEELSFELVENEGKNGIILRQGSNVFTLWYGKVTKEKHLYQYHRIGHFWVKGHEKWRRLVYIVGTMYEKYSFMGEEACDIEELELIPLVGFAPFRYWTPLKESLDGWYPNTFEGIVTMRHIAETVNDKSFLRKLDMYEKLFMEGKANERVVRKMARELTKSRHESIYNYINSKIDEASSQYGERVYDEKTEERITVAREQVTSSFLMKGYKGNYPILYKNNHKIVFYEEHPFIMSEFEYEDFDFKIHALF